MEGKRDRAILAVLLGCALRGSELAALDSRHIQQRDDRWVFVDLVGKGKRIRTVPIPPFVKVAISGGWRPRTGHRVPSGSGYVGGASLGHSGWSETTLLPGTEGGSDPFFSPDGQFSGFFTQGEIKKISIPGGVPITLSGALLSVGASWGEDGNIVAGLGSSTPLYRIPADGGTRQLLRNLAPTS